MNSNATSTSRFHSVSRRAAAALLATAMSACAAVSAFAADAVVLRVGDQKGGNRSLLEISSLAHDLPYKIEWSEFPAAAPVLEALNAGALDVGYTGDLAFLSVYAVGAPIKAVGGTRSDARTQAILVREDSPIRTVADLKGKRLAGTRGGWAVWEPYVSYARLKDGARVVADGEGLTPTITFIVASDNAIATKRAAIADLVQRLDKARLWSLDHLGEYARSTAELTKLPEDVLLAAYTAQRTSPITIDDNVVKEVQTAANRATRYGILNKTLDVSKAVDRSFAAGENSN